MTSNQKVSIAISRSGQVVRDWVELQRSWWADDIDVAAIDVFRGYATASPSTTAASLHQFLQPSRGGFGRVQPDERRSMQFCLGIDVACRAAHQAALADSRGELLWSGQRFRTTAVDLEGLWARLPPGDHPPNHSSSSRAVVVVVPPERSADLRYYYNKHTKTDRRDARVLDWLPLLHPEGPHPEEGQGQVARVHVRRDDAGHPGAQDRPPAGTGRPRRLLDRLTPPWRHRATHPTPVDQVLDLGRREVEQRFPVPAELVHAGHPTDRQLHLRRHPLDLQPVPREGGELLGRSPSRALMTAATSSSKVGSGLDARATSRRNQSIVHSRAWPQPGRVPVQRDGPPGSHLRGPAHSKCEITLLAPHPNRSP